MEAEEEDSDADLDLSFDDAGTEGHRGEEENATAQSTRPPNLAYWYVSDRQIARDCRSSSRSWWRKKCVLGSLYTVLYCFMLFLHCFMLVCTFVCAKESWIWQEDEYYEIFGTQSQKAELVDDDHLEDSESAFDAVRIAIYKIENHTFQGCFLHLSSAFSMESSTKRWRVLFCNSQHLHQIP